MKRCSRCKQIKPDEEYYKRKDRGSLLPACKECLRQAQNAYYQGGRGKEIVRAYRETVRGQEVLCRANAKYEASEKRRLQRERYKPRGRELARKYTRTARHRAYMKEYRNKPSARERQRRYDRSEKRRQYRKEYVERTRESRRLQRQATNRVHHAVRSGRLERVRSLFCVRCGDPAEEYHHHKGYQPEHQLDVIPMCVPCHRFEDIGVD